MLVEVGAAQVRVVRGSLQQMVDQHEDAVSHGYRGLLDAAPGRQSMKLRRQVGVGAAGHGVGRLHQGVRSAGFRPYAVRKPRDYLVQQPGDLVQRDTQDVRPVPGVVLKHFTSQDVTSRWNVLDLHSRATAGTATQALETIQQRMPFSIRAIQVDGGSEFMADFERTCQAKGIRLFQLPPRSPKLNGGVERANRTHTEEFYECSLAEPTVADLGAELRAWCVPGKTCTTPSGHTRRWAIRRPPRG